MQSRIAATCLAGMIIFLSVLTAVASAGTSSQSSEHEDSTVFVKVTRSIGAKRATSLGNAFVIRSDGFLLTTQDCVASTQRVWSDSGFRDITAHVRDLAVVVDSGTDREQELPARIVLEDPKRGLALLKVEHEFPSSLALSDNIRPEVSERVSVVGYASEGEFGDRFDPVADAQPDFSKISGRVTALRRRADRSVSLIETSIEVKPSQTGAPLIDKQGGLIGVVSLGLRGGGDVAFAIPVETIREFLDWCSYKVIFRPPSIHPGLKELTVDILPVFEDLGQVSGYVTVEGRDVREKRAQLERTDTGYRAHLIIDQRVYGVLPPDHYDATLKLRVPGVSDQEMRRYRLPATDTDIEIVTRQDLYWTGEDSLYGKKQKTLGDVAEVLNQRDESMADGFSESEMRRSESGSLVIDRNTLSSFGSLSSPAYDLLESDEQKQLAAEYDRVYREFCNLTEVSQIPAPIRRPGMTQAQYNRLVQQYQRAQIDARNWARYLVEIADKVDVLYSKLNRIRVGKCEDGKWRQGTKGCRVPSPGECR